MTRLEAKRLLMRVIDEVEQRLGLESGAIISDRRHKRDVMARQLIMLIGVEEMGLTLTPLGRMLRRDHTTVMWGIRKARVFVAQEPWQSLHAELVAYVRHGTPVTQPAPPEPEELAPDEPPAEPSRLTSARGGGDWPDRAACERQNAQFLAAMRRAHPEMEREIRRAPS